MNKIPPEAIYSLGDLVRVKEAIDFIEFGFTVNIGEVGVVVFIHPDDNEYVSLWGVDYMVLIRGRKLLFFEDELELVEKNKI